jgi:hypothetical protein
MPDQPLMPEGDFLLYLLEVSAAGALPSLRFKGFGDVNALERQERAALYALGRIRESLCFRLKRLEPKQAEQRDFLLRLLATAQGEGGDQATAPRWPAQALCSVVGMIRDRLAARRRAA